MLSKVDVDSEVQTLRNAGSLQRAGEPCLAALCLCRPPWPIAWLLAELSHLSTSFSFAVFINSLS